MLGRITAQKNAGGAAFGLPRKPNMINPKLKSPVGEKWSLGSTATTRTPSAIIVSYVARHGGL